MNRIKTMRNLAMAALAFSILGEAELPAGQPDIVAGLSPPANHLTDGSDSVPVLRSGIGDPQRVLHWRFGSQWAVRKGDWKPVDGKTLYFLGNDPEEPKDLAAEPEIARGLRILNQQWTRGAGTR
jgi:arylsulfatase A-like enzyme